MQTREPDPTEEYFDIVDADGIPTGEVKRRSDVHTDGDWHCAFHCWVVLHLADGSPAVLFQRRSPNKDTYPRHLDVAVGGHYRAGEGFDEVVREIEEELGIAPPRDGLVRVGRRRAVGRGDTWIDREIEDVYVHCLAASLEALRPAYEEVTAVDVVRMSALEQLFDGTRARVDSLRYRVRRDNTLAGREMAMVNLDDFIPVSDSYWLLGSRAAVQVLEGRPDVRLDLW